MLMLIVRLENEELNFRRQQTPLLKDFVLQQLFQYLFQPYCCPFCDILSPFLTQTSVCVLQ